MWMYENEIHSKDIKIKCEEAILLHFKRLQDLGSREIMFDTISEMECIKNYDINDLINTYFKDNESVKDHISNLKVVLEYQSLLLNRLTSIENDISISEFLKNKKYLKYHSDLHFNYEDTDHFKDMFYNVYYLFPESVISNHFNNIKSYSKYEIKEFMRSSLKEIILNNCVVHIGEYHKRFIFGVHEKINFLLYNDTKQLFKGIIKNNYNASSNYSPVKTILSIYCIILKQKYILSKLMNYLESIKG